MNWASCFFFNLNIHRLNSTYIISDQTYEDPSKNCDDCVSMLFNVIYIYIYIYSHSPTDCFIVSQIFGVAKHVGYLKLGSKPTQLYVRRSIIPLSHQANHVSLGIMSLCSRFSLFTFFALPDTKVLNSFEELCIMQVAAGNSFPRVLKPPWGSVYIVTHIQAVSLYHIYICGQTYRTLEAYFTRVQSACVYIYTYTMYELKVSWAIKKKELHLLLGVVAIEKGAFESPSTTLG